MKPSTLRVLHCPNGIAGNPQQIARAERSLGLASQSILFTPHAFGYPADKVLLPNGSNRLTLEIARWRLLWKALRNFDVIHFNFGQTITCLAPDYYKDYALPIRMVYNLYTSIVRLRDLPLLKRFGKVIAMTYQGDDARQGDYCRAHFPIHFVYEVEPTYYTAETDALKRADIARVARYADLIYALNPDLLYVLPPQAQFLPYASVDLREWQPVPASPDPDRPLTILHAPSHRGVKGTRYVLEAVERLKSEGIPIELILVENMSHREARRLYERADLLIDQLLAGWYGGLAVELMALGKPVICYLREDDLGFLPPQMRAELPIINAAPHTIYDVLKTWTTVRRDELSEVGRRSRAYVERWHDPLSIAARLKNDYEAVIASRLV